MAIREVLPCPWCRVAICDRMRGLEYDDDELAVVCHACGAMGPEGHDEHEAVDLWNAMPRTATAPVHIEETPEVNGSRMVLRYGMQELVVVDFVHEDYAATMRGALTLIGGMRQAEENEHVS